MPSLRYVEFASGGNFLTLGTLLSPTNYLRRVVFNTKQKVVLGSDIFENCPLIERVSFHRDISSIEGASSEGYVCPNGGSCGCSAGFENEEASGSNYFSCTQCGPGYYSGSTSVDKACQLCAPGTYSDESGASTCLQCEVGKHLATEGGNSIAMCENCKA